jgi:hypothetical protein
VMHALHQGHGWSIARIAREFDITWRTARRYVTAETVPRYRPGVRPAELSQVQAAPITRRLGAHPELRATTLYREVQELGYAVPTPCSPDGFACCARSIPRPTRRCALRPTPASRSRRAGPTAASGWSASSCAVCRPWSPSWGSPGWSRCGCHRYHPPHDAAAADRVPGRPWWGAHRGPHRPGSGAGDRRHTLGPAGVRPGVGRPGRGARYPPSGLPGHCCIGGDRLQTARLPA